MEQRISSFLAKYGTTEYAFQLLALLASILIGWSIARLYEFLLVPIFYLCLNYPVRFLIF